MKKIFKFVITGGPCGGKTTALEKINNYFTKKGFGVITVSETATELINAGIAPWTLSSKYEFQRAILLLQLKKEDIFINATNFLKDYDKIIIIFDRGVMDNKAYLGQSEFSRLIGEYSFSEQTLLKRYDAVFHLETTAKNAQEYYTLSNNSARKENIQEAIELDDKTIDAWHNHSNFYILDNTTNFEEKLQKLINLIENNIKL